MTIRHTLEDYLPAARVVVQTNPHQQGRDPKSLAKWFMGLVERNLDSPSYLSCAGLVATTFHMDGAEDLPMHVKVTVEPYGIEEYLKEQRT